MGEDDAMTAPTRDQAGIQYGYFGHIAKYEETDDGTLLVYGKAAGPDIDLDEQICDPTWLKTAMPDWSRWSNVREQHSNIAAGVGVELTQDGDDWYLKAEIVDPTTIKKVVKRVLKGFSVGIANGHVIRDAKARGGRINAGTITEISLVDRPSNPTATLSIAKSADGVTLAPVEVEPDEVPELERPAEVDELDEPDGDAASDFDFTGDLFAEDVPSLFSDLDGDQWRMPDGSTLRIVDDPLPPERTPEQRAELIEKTAGWYRDALRTVEDVLAGQWSHAVPYITKAAAPADENERADVAAAHAAIDQVLDLIISEAQQAKGGRVKELRDIEVLLSSCRALVRFVDLEEDEDDLGDDDVNVGDDDEMIYKAAGGGAIVGADTAEIITKAVTAARAEMQQAHEAEIATLRAKLDKAEAVPLMGGPVTFARTQTSSAPVQAASPADEWRTMADAPGLAPEIKRAYLAKAASLEPGAST